MLLFCSKLKGLMITWVNIAFYNAKRWTLTYASKRTMCFYKRGRIDSAIQRESKRRYDCSEVIMVDRLMRFKEMNRDLNIISHDRWSEFFWLRREELKLPCVLMDLIYFLYRSNSSVAHSIFPIIAHRSFLPSLLALQLSFLHNTHISLPLTIIGKGREDTFISLSAQARHLQTCTSPTVYPIKK